MERGGGYLDYPLYMRVEKRPTIMARSLGQEREGEFNFLSQRGTAHFTFLPFFSVLASVALSVKPFGLMDVDALENFQSNGL